MWHLFSNSLMRCVMFLFRVHFSNLQVAVGNIHVRIIRSFILIFVTFNSLQHRCNIVFLKRNSPSGILDCILHSGVGLGLSWREKHVPIVVVSKTFCRPISRRKSGTN